MFYRNYAHRSNLFGASIVAFLAGAAAWAIFGKKIKTELNHNPEFRDLKKQISNKVSQITDITREKYDEIVDEVTDKYARAKGISKNEISDLTDDLKRHWGRIKNAWYKGGEKTQ